MCDRDNNKLSQRKCATVQIFTVKIEPMHFIPINNRYNLWWIFYCIHEIGVILHASISTNGVKTIIKMNKVVIFGFDQYECMFLLVNSFDCTANHNDSSIFITEMFKFTVYFNDLNDLLLMFTLFQAYNSVFGISIWHYRTYPESVICVFQRVSFFFLNLLLFFSSSFYLHMFSQYVT